METLIRFDYIIAIWPSLVLLWLAFRAGSIAAGMAQASS